MIPRPHLDAAVRASLARNPITTLLGPRQCGKTTLARSLRASHPEAHFFDLEDPVDLARLRNPALTLEPLRGLVVLDEVQRVPEVFPLLRVLADRPGPPARFLLLGSASPDLVRETSESLAGRVHFIEMAGFTLEEAGDLTRLWFRGGFPRAFLADTDAAAMEWLADFVRTFLERDLPQLGIRLPAATLRRFWTMVAHVHGNVWSGSDLASSLGVAHTTIRRYLDLLSGALVVRQLPPWFENAGKRVVKSPKVYVRDAGVLHALLGMPDLTVLHGHPKLGASWEGFGVEQVVAWAGERCCWFWATHGGAELDLLVLRHGRRLGFELKVQDAPTMTRSMHVALADLKLDHLWVLHPGGRAWPIHERVDVIPMADLPALMARIDAEAAAG